MQREEGAQQSSVLQYDFLPVVLSAGAIQEGGFWAKSSLAFHYNLPPAAAAYNNAEFSPQNMTRLTCVGLAMIIILM